MYIYVYIYIYIGYCFLSAHGAYLSIPKGDFPHRGLAHRDSPKLFKRCFKNVRRCSKHISKMFERCSNPPWGIPHGGSTMGDPPWGIPHGTSPVVIPHGVSPWEIPPRAGEVIGYVMKPWYIRVCQIVTYFENYLAFSISISFCTI